MSQIRSLGTLLSKSELQVLCVSIAAVTCARLPVLFYAHGLDDYPYYVTSRPLGDYVSLTLGDGRFGEAGLLLLLHELGLRQGGTPAVSTLLCAVLLGLIGILICRLWSMGESPVTCALVTGLLTLHPYLADSSEAQTTALTTIVAFLAAVLAAYLLTSRPGLILPIALVVGCCSVYQVALGYFFVVVLATILVVLCAEPSPERLLWARRLFLKTCAVVLSSVAIYLLVEDVVRRLSGVPAANRFGVLAPHDWGARSKQVAVLLKTVFVLPEPFMFAGTKVLLLGILIVSAVSAGAFLLRFRANAQWQRWMIPIGAPLTLGVLALSSVGTIAVALEWWPAPRTLQGFGVFWACVLAIGLKTVAPRVQPWLLICALVLCVSFAGTTNQILNDRLRGNIRDSAEVNRILGRLEAVPGFAGNVHSLAVVGDAYTWPLTLETMYYDSNISAMAHSWSKVPFIDEITGYTFDVPSPEMEATARTYCASAPLWPAERSIAVRGDLAIVCFARQ